MAKETKIIFNTELLDALIRNKKLPHWHISDFCECDEAVISRLRTGKITGTSMRTLYLVAKYFDMRMEDFVIDQYKGVKY